MLVVEHNSRIILVCMNYIKAKIGEIVYKSNMNWWLYNINYKKILGERNGPFATHEHSKDTQMHSCLW